MLGFDTCVQIAAQYSGPGGARLTESTLFPALKIVVERHAALGIRIDGPTTGRPLYTRLQTINLSKIVEFSEESLETVLERQFTRPFDTNTEDPLWRVVVANSDIVVFAFHHGIGDGKSGVCFHRSLLDALRSISPTKTEPVHPETIVIPTTTVFTPAVETRTNINPSLRKIGQALSDVFLPASWTRGAYAWTGNIVADRPVLQVHVKLIRFSADDISRFLVKCRSHRATLTSTLHSLAVSVISGLIPKDSPFKTISTSIPVSLRSVTDTPPDVFCDYVSSYQSHPPINSTFSWNTASELASILRTHPLKSREDIGLLKLLFGNYVAYFKGQLNSKRGGGLEFSNVGRFVDPSGEAEGWNIRSMAFAQADATVGSAIKLNVVGAPDGGVTIAVTWGDGAVADSFVESFATGFEQDFQQILATND